MYYVEVTHSNGERYGIQAVELDDMIYAPHVSILDAHGEPVKTIVDSQTTDEAYSSGRDCLLHAMIHVI